MTTFTRRLGPLLLALVFVAGLTAAPTGVAEVRAATPDLTIVSDARYDVQPAQSRVRVTVTLRLTNHLKDTTTKRYYFDEAFLAVLPGATGLRLTGAGSPGVSVNRRTANATILKLKLGSRLFSGKSATYTLHFDLVDGGGAATRDLRIGDVARLVPGLGVRLGLHAGQHRDRGVPGRLRDDRRGRRPARARPRTATARSSTGRAGSRRRSRSSPTSSRTGRARTPRRRSRRPSTASRCRC